MRKDRLYEEKLLVNGKIGGEELSKNERTTLRHDAAELKERIEAAKKEDIYE